MVADKRILSARLEGRNVLLRPVRPQDAGPAFRMLRDCEPILRWLLWRGPHSEEELGSSYASWARVRHPVGRGETLEYLFAVEERETGAFLGTVGVETAGEPARVDLGYWLGERFWGRGLGTEAVALGVSFAFRQLGAESITAWVFVGNDASRRVLEKNGFHLVTTVKNKLERDGIRRDEWSFVLLREEWLQDDAAERPFTEDIRLA